MATIGSLVIGLSLGTAGLAMGLNNVEAQLKAFQNRVNGQGAMTAQAAAYEQVRLAQQGVVLAQAELSISTMRVNELQARGVITGSAYAAAQLRVQKSTIALAAAQADLVAAQNLARAPVVASQMGGSFPFITAAATIAGYALVQFSLNAARAATDFEYEMRLVQTQAAASREEVVRLSDSILQMAPGLQTGPMDLSKSMFRFKSVGLDEANALDAMRVAAMGARVGNASLDSVTTALIATMISGIKGITGWDQAMGMLNATVGVSNLRMEDLTNSLSSGILSTAKQFGLSFLDVGAALGVMSNQAVPAEEGATRLRISIALLAAPTAIAGRELAKIGLTQRDLADQMRGQGGLIGALTLLKDRMDAAGLDATEQSILLKTAFGGSRSSAGILLLMNSLDDLGKMYSSIQAKSGTFMQDWAAESETASAKFATFSATMEVLSVRIGNGLLPVLIGLAAILGFVADKTLIVVPLFYLLITALSIALVRAIWGAISGLVTLTGHMIMNVVAGIAMRALFSNMGPIIAGNMAIAGGGVGAFTTQMAAANLAAAGLVNTTGGAIGTVGGVGAAAGAAAGPVGALGGALGGTAAAASGIVPGLAGASGAMAAAAGSTGPLVAGLAGASGAMAAVAGSTGPLVAGLAGANGAMAAAAGSTGPLVVGLAGASGAMAATTGAAGGLILPVSALGPAGVAGGAGIGVAGTAAAAAAPAMWNLAAATTATALPVYVVIGAVVALAAVIVLLIMNVDKVVAVFKGWYASGLELINALLQLLSMIPLIGDAFKGAASEVNKSLNDTKAEINDIMGTGPDANFNPLGDISKLVQLQIDQAKAQAASGFEDLNMTLIDLYGTSMAGVQAAAMAAGQADMAAYAKGIRDAQDLPKTAFSDLLSALETAMTPEQEAARLIGELQSEELANGLASGTPAVVATAEALRKAIIDRLNEISDGAYAASQQTWDQWFAGWRDAQMAAGEGSSEITMSLRLGGTDQLKADFERLKSEWANSLAPTPEQARAAMEALRLEVSNGTASVSDAAKAFVKQFGYDLSALKDIGATAGADMMAAIADEIESKSDAVMTAISKLHDVITNGMSTAAQEAFLIAALTGDEIVNGLASKEPEVYARAVHARDIIIEQLNFLSGGAYSAGSSAARALIDGLTANLGSLGVAIRNQLNLSLGGASALGLTPEQLAQGKTDYQKYLDSLSASSSSFTSQYKSDMTTAFNEIKAKALEYFQTVHDRTIKAIEDARDHKNALLDAKEALNQAPVTAAQRALDAQRKAIQEWRLRQAVATASNPEEYRDAVLALQDFLAQKKIDQMQAETDLANDVIDAQKKANEEQAQARIDAENDRYEKQKKDFQRGLTALESYLKNHPEAWRKTQREILSLLNDYGISYRNAGNLLGGDFAAGLLEQVEAAQAAGTALANAASQGAQARAAEIAAAAASAAASSSIIANSQIHPVNTSGPGKALGGPVYKGQPTWVGEVGRELFVPQMNGYVLNHTDSMRAASSLEPAASPVSLDAIRRATERPEVPTGNARVDIASSRASEGVHNGKVTVVFQVGDRVFGEMTDVAMYQQQALSQSNSVVKVGGSRR